MTEPSDVAAAVARHPFLQRLRPEHRAALLPGATLQDVPAGALLGREGEAATAFHLVVHGRVAVEIHTPKRGAVRLQTVGDGEVLGWSWLLTPQRRQFDLRALQPTRVLVLDGPGVRAACDADHELGFHLVRALLDVVAGRLSAARLQLLDIYR
jgi:CRP-like cAMP-binding protein